MSLLRKIIIETRRQVVLAYNVLQIGVFLFLNVEDKTMLKYFTYQPIWLMLLVVFIIVVNEEVRIDNWLCHQHS